MKICVVIPAYNESRTIGSIVKSLSDRSLDVLVIDDGSMDGTGAIAAHHGAAVITHDRRNGKGSSLRKGFQYALNRGYDGVIAMDGDGQHDINDLGRFVELAQQHKACIINGNRMTDANAMPFMRLCTNRFMSWLISMTCRQNIPDSQCGYRYIACDVLREIELTSREYEIESEILIKASKRGFKIFNVPVQTIYSDEKSLIRPIKDTFRFFAYYFRELLSPKDAKARGLSEIKK